MIGALGEDRLIEIFAAEPGSGGARLIVPNGDDAAVYMVEAPYASVVTTDTLVEGVHFDLAYTNPRFVGRKLMAVNLSDIAAMGARPRYVLLSVTLPPTLPVAVASALAEGIREQCREYGVSIIGGNTARTRGPVVLTAVLIGRVHPDQVIRRRGTLVGDALYVTGSLGQAAAGLRLATGGGWHPTRSDQVGELFLALVDPVPRIEAGRVLAKTGLVHAMCDISDGLGRDLTRLLGPEGLGARIQTGALPISPALRRFAAERGEAAEALALAGGEDYELLFTADPDQEKTLGLALAAVGTPVTRIGEVTAAPEIEVIMPDGAHIAPPRGYDHFEGER